LSDKHRHPSPRALDIVVVGTVSTLVSRDGSRMNVSTAETRSSGKPTRDLVKSSQIRVVIVEDSAIIRARLAESLNEILNLTVVGEAETEADAVAILRDRAWDAVILDLQLKVGTGLGVLRKLKEIGRPDDAKVIVFTNYSFPQYRDRSLSLGADYFFDKSREFHRVRDVLTEMASGETSH
jgi:CheY-like chemotaxis protein